MTQVNHSKEHPKEFQISKVFGPFSFAIQDTSNFGEYIGGGVVSEVKTQTSVSFVCDLGSNF
jgi:hypothetical protein